MRDFLNMSDGIRYAYLLAEEAHKGQKDKAGKDYIFHPMRVASIVKDEESHIITALLHDVVEDTDITIDDLRDKFSNEIIESLKLLTHDKSVDYREYVIGLRNNDIARDVKMSDLIDNMNLDRFDIVTDKDRDRVKFKYKPSFMFLIGALSENEYRDYRK